MHGIAIRDIGNSAGRTESKRKSLQRITQIADIEPLKGGKSGNLKQRGGRQIDIERTGKQRPRLFFT